MISLPGAWRDPLRGYDRPGASVNNTHSRTYAPRDRRCHDVVSMSPARPDEMAANRKSVYDAALLMVVVGNTLYEREWSRAELIGSSRTFQRGNDSVCTDPSFTSVQVESRLYNRKSFRPYSPLSFSHFVAIFSQEWVIPLTFTTWRVLRSRRLDPTLYIAIITFPCCFFFARRYGKNYVHLSPLRLIPPLFDIN